MTRRRYRKHLQAAYDLGYRHVLDGQYRWQVSMHHDPWIRMAYDCGRRDAELAWAEGFA